MVSANPATDPGKLSPGVKALRSAGSGSRSKGLQREGRGSAAGSLPAATHKPQLLSQPEQGAAPMPSPLQSRSPRAAAERTGPGRAPGAQEPSSPPRPLGSLRGMKKRTGTENTVPGSPEEIANPNNRILREGVWRKRKRRNPTISEPADVNFQIQTVHEGPGKWPNNSL